MEIAKPESLETLGFVARVFVQASIPHRNVKSNEYIRQNGDYTLTMIAPSSVGLPYGATPRLLLAWLTTEVQSTRDRELDLGDSVAGFMRQLGMPATSGKRGSVNRLKDQMNRLLGCLFRWDMNGTSDWGQVTIADGQHTRLWWDSNDAEQMALFRSVIVLSEAFYVESLYNAVPVDFNVMRALNRSPMALDIYTWLTHRVCGLKRPTNIPWYLLQEQFGAGYPDTPQGKSDFRANFLKQLEDVRQHYSAVRAGEGKSGLLIKPSNTHVPKKLMG
jgi:hypothetical protein